MLIMMPIFNFYVLFGVTFLLSFLIVWYWQKALRAKEILDRPNERSSHSIPTPRAGGVGIFLSFFIGLSFLWILIQKTNMGDVFLLAGSLFVFCVGLMDDFQSTKRRVRLSIHFIASFFIIIWMWNPFQDWAASFGFGIFFPAFLCGLWILGIVWSINLFNFMDGINGIAGMEAVFLSSALAILFAYENRGEQIFYKLILLSVATLGFIIWNFPRAVVFLGDAGSGFLGYVIAAFASYAYLVVDISIWTLLTISSLFWMDATFTILKRLQKKEKIFNAHNSHAYQILARKWKSHASVTIAFSIVNVLILLPLGFAMQRFEDLASLLFLILLIVMASLYLKISQLEEKNAT
ncbi:MAG: glycosyltransferase family 4 protein [Leptospira sp.]|nr:glycosyltransferase family 4 protein [Leptospira sp.]